MKKKRPGFAPRKAVEKNFIEASLLLDDRDSNFFSAATSSNSSKQKKVSSSKNGFEAFDFFRNFLNSWLLKLGEETEKLRPAPSVFDF